MFDRHYQQQARADIIAAMERVVHKQSKFDIHSIKHCMLCAYYRRSKNKHPEVERFEDEYVSGLFGIPEDAAKRVFALRRWYWDGEDAIIYNPQANLARLIAAFEEHPL